MRHFPSRVAFYENFKVLQKFLKITVGLNNSRKLWFKQYISVRCYLIRKSSPCAILTAGILILIFAALPALVQKLNKTTVSWQQSFLEHQNHLALKISKTQKSHYITNNNQNTESTALGSVAAAASCPRVSLSTYMWYSVERRALLMMVRRVRWSGRVCPANRTRVATGRMESTAVGGHSRRRPPAVPGGGDGKLRDIGTRWWGAKAPDRRVDGLRDNRSRADW